MRQKKKIFASILMATTFLTSSVTVAAKTYENFTNVISFGDSFTWADNGWAALMTQRYGVKFEQNKNNFSATTLNLSDQYANYKANVAAIPHALFMVYTGPSDMMSKNQIDGFVNHLSLIPDLVTLEGQLPGLDLSAQIKQGIQSHIATFRANGVPDNQIFAIIIALAQQMQDKFFAEVGRLRGEFTKTFQNDGGNYLVQLTHFNEYYRQYQGGDTDEKQKLNGANASKEYNKAIADGIAQHAPNANVIYADFARLVEEISNNPTAYLSPQDIAGTYRDWGFFDMASHPTAAAQKITAQYVASVIESPSRVALVRELP
ncbi:SGNH/GDSL hydrolase family protein [Candidatus Tisiphia endosymbiont of Nemotelus uliginosus]|uniref:SGNH/GDSL hydrolase family protein n=1 Tax=Candidatus Tisiphia endosymbiont of Nemotelus uliginosus TaxID=3077926 RepID=UPI0035C895F5